LSEVGGHGTPEGVSASRRDRTAAAGREPNQGPPTTEVEVGSRRNAAGQGRRRPSVTGIGPPRALGAEASQMIDEFKDFINKGNVVDLAVAFVMGLAIAAVITAVVERVVMPLIALLVGQPNFDAIGTFGDNGSVGAVITAVVNFLLVALVLFFIVKAYNKTKTPPETEVIADPEEILLLREIRDSLRQRS
jgi:large conductance mechanosensitive channel